MQRVAKKATVAPKKAHTKAVSKSTVTSTKRAIRTAPKKKAIKKVSGTVGVAKRGFASDELASAAKTALYDEHVAAGGKMVPFCGYALPVQYADSLTQSHNHVRTAAGLFDVSHMGQITLKGNKRNQFIETLIVADVDVLKPNLAKLTVLTNENGGVIDDCMITKRDDDLYMVLNAGCKDKDMAHIKTHLAKFNEANPDTDPVTMTYHDKRSLVALQGPKAAAIMKALLPDIDFVNLPFMGSLNTKLKGIDIHMTRCGYTGEDGFEIGCDDKDAVALWKTLLDNDDAKPAGLGVRDSLRLEAGLCLYGHELDETITPVEASLAWTISPRRKREGGFLGSDVVLGQLTTPPTRKLMGIEILAGAPARQGATLHDDAGKQVGIITSGGPAPSLNMKKIAIAYMDTAFTTPDMAVQVNVRGKMSPAAVKALPFVPHNYYRIPKV